MEPGEVHRSDDADTLRLRSDRPWHFYCGSDRNEFTIQKTATESLCDGKGISHAREIIEYGFNR